ncbi:MAG: DNA polymerase III subunit gamma/tau [Candidatus Tokpelaia sp. JSC188]|nr:MAG: DNA polymerase III subunit gamma/tau [Candidatus Tokpelaia sp. JSC188]
MKIKTAEKAYHILARKYRPEGFSSLIGQESMIRTLTNAFEAGRIAQAWMLTGTRGVGKTTTARILARALNYETDKVNKPTIELQIPGKHCQAIMESRHVDVLEMDAASHTGIDNIREIIEHIRYRPILARYKVYIIDEVHMLSPQAFNGLLKTLEEPPSHAKFIFATTEIRKVPLTVLSRCQRFDLRRIDITTLVQHLKKISDAENVRAEEAALFMIARVAEGSVRDALSILDQAINHGNEEVRRETVQSMLGLADRAQIIDLFSSIMSGEITAALRVFKNLYDTGVCPISIIIDLAEFTHLVTRMRVTPEVAKDMAFSEEERLCGRSFAEKLSIRVLSRCWQMLLKGSAEIENCMRPFQAAEMLLIRLTYAADLPTLDESLKIFTSTSNTAIIKAIPAESKPTSSSLISSLLTKKSTTALVPAVDKKRKHFESLQDIIRFADEKNDIQFKFIIKEFIRPISFKPGYIEFSPAKKPPYNLSWKIAKTLHEWTDEHWVVKMVDEGGGQTIAEKEQSKRDALLSDTENDVDVAAVLSSFPGSKVVDVRFSKQNDKSIKNGSHDDFDSRYSG